MPPRRIPRPACWKSSAWESDASSMRVTWTRRSGTSPGNGGFFDRPCGGADRGFRAVNADKNRPSRDGIIHCGLLIADLFGLDKFTSVMTDWTTYLAPGDRQTSFPATPRRPWGSSARSKSRRASRWPSRRGSARMWSRCGSRESSSRVSPTLSGLYDVALRDFGLPVGALALAQASAGDSVSAINTRTSAARSNRLGLYNTGRDPAARCTTKR